MTRRLERGQTPPKRVCAIWNVGYHGDATVRSLGHHIDDANMNDLASLDISLYELDDDARCGFASACPVPPHLPWFENRHVHCLSTADGRTAAPQIVV